jgi:hypothetical protein
MSEKCFVIKDGLYYRPNSVGYTAVMCRAGLFDVETGQRWAQQSGGELKVLPLSDLEKHEINRLIADSINLSQIMDQLAISDEAVLLPRKLTAENGAKSLLMGEFSEKVQVACAQCADIPEDSCPDCNGTGYVDGEVPVSWDTLKRIYAMVVEHLGASELEHGHGR